MSQGCHKLTQGLNFGLPFQSKVNKHTTLYMTVWLPSGHEKCPILQKTAFSMVKSRLGRDHPIVRLVECHHAENGLIPREMVVDCPIVITSIGDSLFQTRPGFLVQEWILIGQASLLHSWLLLSLCLHLFQRLSFNFCQFLIQLKTRFTFVIVNVVPYSDTHFEAMLP